jgi:hypothetical protein
LTDWKGDFLKFRIVEFNQQEDYKDTKI